MFYRLVIPKDISDSKEIRLLEWHFAEGEAFENGALILEIETQKAIIEICSQQSGILRKKYFQEGEWIALIEQTLIALFSDSANEPLPESTEDLNPINVDVNII